MSKYDYDLKNDNYFKEMISENLNCSIDDIKYIETEGYNDDYVEINGKPYSFFSESELVGSGYEFLKSTIDSNTLLWHVTPLEFEKATNIPKERFQEVLDKHNYEYWKTIDDDFEALYEQKRTIEKRAMEDIVSIVENEDMTIYEVVNNLAENDYNLGFTFGRDDFVLEIDYGDERIIVTEY